MKDSKKFFAYGFAWIVVFVVFHAIALLIPPLMPGFVKFTGTFYLGLIMVDIALIIQLAVNLKYLTVKTNSQRFYNASQLTMSIAFVIVSFIVGGIFILVPVFPSWIGGIIALIISAVYVVKTASAAMAVTEVERVEDKVRNDTYHIKMLTAEAQALMARTQAPTLKKETERVYEALRYTDPVSNPALMGVEQKLEDKFRQFSYAVDSGNIGTAIAVSAEVIAAVNERASLVRALK